MVIKDYRHTWYERTVYLADLYRKLATGDGLDDLLKQYVKREDDDAFSQRKALTEHIVTSVVHNLMDVFYKVPRAPLRRVLEHSAEDKRADLSEKTAALQNRLDIFWGIRSLDNYVQTRWLEINKTDPNAFIVVEFAPFDARFERAAPYPFEVYSKQAVDYEYQNNVLQHLIAETEIALPTKSNSRGKGKKYTVYLENESFTLTQVASDTPGIPLSTEKDKYTFTDTGGWLRTGDKVYFLQFYPPHNAGRVPAKQAGYLRDGWTNGQTFVTPYEAAVPFLRKSVKVNSELDITMTQQVFPHRLQYAPKCPEHDCINGKQANGGLCPTCHGTGISSISSAQDVIYIKLPKDSEDLLDLDKLLVFKSPAVDVVTFQKEYVEHLTDQCKTAVFNSDIFTRSEVADTATGKTLDLQNVYDTLYTCSLGYAETWQFLVEMTAEFTGLETGLRAELIFSKDFKLKGISDLLADLEAANRAQAGSVVTGAIQEDIMRIMFAENPQAFKKWEVKRAFDPFAGLTSEQVNMALTNTDVPKRLKVKYLLMSAIFAELEQESDEKGEDFYSLAARVQKERIEAKVKAYMDETQAAMPTLIPPANGLPQMVEN